MRSASPSDWWRGRAQREPLGWGAARSASPSDSHLRPRAARASKLLLLLLLLMPLQLLLLLLLRSPRPGQPGQQPAETDGPRRRPGRRPERPRRAGCGRGVWRGRLKCCGNHDTCGRSGRRHKRSAGTGALAAAGAGGETFAVAAAAVAAEEAAPGVAPEASRRRREAITKRRNGEDDAAQDYDRFRQISTNFNKLQQITDANQHAHENHWTKSSN